MSKRVEKRVNYFEILGLSIEELQGLDEDAIVKRVKKDHNEIYQESLNLGDRLRPDGIRESDWRQLLNQARNILTDPHKREAHVADLQQDVDDRPILTFRNGDEAFNIPQLAKLMLKNSKDAIDALYRGYLEQMLGGAGEMHFADAALAVVSEFPANCEIGFRVMVSILQGEMEFQEGQAARTPAQLANAIDLNWDQAKDLLFNGFIAIWLEYTKQPELAEMARNVTDIYKDEQDIGVEKVVQSLNPRIGHPKLHISPESINFGNIDTETQKKIQLEIKNTGRGFLYGNIQLTEDIPGLQLSTMTIRGNTRVTLELNASLLALKKAYKTELVVNANTGDPTAPSSQYVIIAEPESTNNTNVGGISGDITIPIACYVDYPVLKSIRRVAVSGALIAAITLAVCLIIFLLGDAGWLATRLTNANFVTLHANWVEWFKWLWTDSAVHRPKPADTGFRFIIALHVMIAGVFAYRFFFLKKTRQP